MKRMLINATQQEELRIALVDGQYLYDLDIESLGKEQKKANIYKGLITKINPSLEAVFVSYGGEREGFLPLKDIADCYFPLDKTGKRNIRDLKEGQEILVQIEKEIRGKKGAALTTYISLAGSFLVLKPNDGRSGGISRHVQGRSRIELKKHLNKISIPKEMSVIARTASLDKTQAELQQDLDALLQYWTEIQEEFKKYAAPVLIHKEIDVITRVFRDYLRDDISEILLDNNDFLERAKKSLTDLGRTDFIAKLHVYQGDVSLFNHFQIEHQIESAFTREVRLKSGGSIVIDVTEALTAIDINSAKSTKGADIEETALTTNLEAAEEIARQLRFRDLGGLIVIDFIDMKPIKNQRMVEERLKEYIKSDRARIQTTKISRFGLIEMSRQRLSSSLRDATHHICPRCEGTGTIRDNNSLSLSILRLIQEVVLKENTSQVEVIVPVEIASYLLNEKRQDIAKIEEYNPDIKVIIAADSQMDTPAYKLIRKRFGEETGILSYQLPKFIREQEESEIEPVEAVEPEKALLTGFKIDKTEKKSSIKVASKTNKSEVKVKSSLFGKLSNKIKNLFTKSDAEKGSAKISNASTKTESTGFKKATTKVKEKSAHRVNSRYKNETKNYKKEDQKEDQKLNNIEIKSEKAPQEKAIAKPFTPKVKREKRILEQSVRVESTNQKNEQNVKKSSYNLNKDKSDGQSASSVHFNSIPTLLNSVAQFDLSGKKEGYKHRPRRTLRHLRMNNQRKRRQNYKDHTLFDFNFASAALEVALCRVYSLEILNHVKGINDLNKEVANENVVSKFSQHYPVMGQILQAVVNIPNLNVSLVEKQQNVANAELQIETHRAKCSSASVTKASFVQNEPKPCLNRMKEETELFYIDLKGAGALTAKEHASSVQVQS